jgi:hypothetical protein
MSAKPAKIFKKIFAHGRAHARIENFAEGFVRVENL